MTVQNPAKVFLLGEADELFDGREQERASFENVTQVPLYQLIKLLTFLFPIQGSTKKLEKKAATKDEKLRHDISKKLWKEEKATIVVQWNFSGINRNT